MDELSLYEHILSVSKPWFVEHIELDKPSDTVHVFVACDFNIALRCPACGKKCSRYDSRKRTWRHLDTCQYQTKVHANVPRTDCPEHGPLLIEVPWAEKGGRYTSLFEAYVIAWLKDASIQAVSRHMQLSWTAIDGIMRRAVRRGLRRRKTVKTRHLSVDEISQKKGRRFVTIISNNEGHVIDIQDGRSKESLGTFYKGLSWTKRSRIRSISMDMSTAYIHSTLEHVPDAKEKICFDKFHVAQDLNKAVDSVRKGEVHKVDKEWRRPLYLSRFLWMRNQDNLTAEHQEKLSNLKTVAARTARAWAIRQYAMTLWGFETEEDAKQAWSKWYGWAVRSRLNPIAASAKSIKKHLWGIVNAIVHKRTNAQAESLNAKIKTLKVRAKGFRNKERLKTAILFHLGGLKLAP